MLLKRRDFLSGIGGLPLAAGSLAVLGRSLRAQPTDGAVRGKIAIHTRRPGTTVSADYTGLSYETVQLANPAFFSASNKELIALFRLLSPQGVLRIGGNSSEFCWWKRAANITIPPFAPPSTQENRSIPHTLTAITPEAIDHLNEFLEATNWTLIYGLNLGTGTPEQAADEAAYVADKIGPRLQYFQIGNEPDLYKKPNNQLRSPDWDFKAYFDQWTQFAKAVKQSVRSAKFGGPDVASDAAWIVEFAKQAPQQMHGSIAACTGHYYAEGPPSNPAMNIERLLRRDPRVATDMKRIMPAARAAGIPYRMTEGNSCYGGGKPGVSNTFASALWSGDYMLYLATLGSHGVNLHGGGSKQIRASLGGHLAGESLGNGAQVAKTGSFYTPIAGSIAEGFFARPVFYGMLLANQFAGFQMVQCDCETPGVNATAYAATKNGEIRIAVFNKDADRDLLLTIASDGEAKAGHVWRLKAAGLEATSGVTLAGAEIGDDGTWRPSTEEKLRRKDGHWTMDLPRGSGALAFLKTSTDETLGI